MQERCLEYALQPLWIFHCGACKFSNCFTHFLRVSSKRELPLESVVFEIHVGTNAVMESFYLNSPL